MTEGLEMTSRDLSQHRRFVDEQLRVTRARIEEAVQRARTSVTRDDEQRWIDTCAAREIEIDALANPEHWPTPRLGLSETEHRVLWVLIAHELCPTVRMHLRTLATEHEADVSSDVLRRVVYGSSPEPRAWHELSGAGALRKLRLLVPLAGDEVPTHRQTFRIPRRMLALVHGQISGDPEMDELLDPRELDFCALDELVIDPEVRERVRASMTAGPPLTILYGLAGSGRRSLLLAAARGAGRKPLTIDARRISHKREEAERQLCTIARECRLLGRTPVMLNLEALAKGGEHEDRVDLVECGFGGPVFATATTVIQRRWRRPPIAIEVPPLPGADRARLWRRALPEASDADADLLATIYPLAPALVTAVGRTAAAEARGSSLEPTHVARAIRSVLDDRLAGLA